MSVNENLPPLPAGTHGSLVDDWQRVYTADQMREYARAAIDMQIDKEADGLMAAYLAGLKHCQDPAPWAPIYSAPKDGTFLIVFGCFPGATTAIEHFGFWDPAEQAWCAQSNTGPIWLENVTYWMPRPAFPPLRRVKP